MSKAKFWSGKCVLVTGASSGIGRAVALELARRGAKVGLIARRTEPLAQLAGEIRAAGGQAEFRAADVTDAAVLSALANELEQSLGACDVAIANAGIYK